MSIELKPIKTKKIYEEIIEQIKQHIQEGRLNPGDKLPPERDLVKFFNVSRASIREALSALQTMGLLEVRTGEGTFVRKPMLEPGALPLNIIFKPDETVINEIFEVRKMIEAQAAGIAAEKATAEELKDLGFILEGMKKELRETHTLRAELDNNFHNKIIQASHNQIAASIFQAINQPIKQLQTHIMFNNSANSHLSKIVGDHQKIYDAILKKDSVKSRHYMLKHLDRMAKLLKP
ncbi:MAG TPA: FadR family transcriptional regulator [Peptococcaceae bacterium]|nr:FadR family transcriptional regulator [Peptococcaceae bacterium]